MHNLELQNFIKLSRYAGERYDLTQAGGGNTSAQLDDSTMLIKASGCLLSEIDSRKGYLQVNTADIRSLLTTVEQTPKSDKREQDTFISKQILNSIIQGVGRPSIETFLHTLLYKYTLHVHPIAVNMITATADWKETLISLFPNAVFGKYQTPGFCLALEVKKQIEAFTQQNKQKPHICFLQNHGLIISYDDVNQVIEQCEKILSKIEQYLNITLRNYKRTNRISNLINSHTPLNQIAFLSDDVFINDNLKKHKPYFFTKPFCPDTLVYCGNTACELILGQEQINIADYFAKHQNLPKVIIFENNVYLIAANINKAKQIQELLKFHLMIISHNKGKVQSLSDNEILYLTSWEAEKYRQNK